MNTLTLVIRSACVDALTAGSRSDARVGPLLKTCREAQIVLRPKHPDTHDPDLRTFFTAELPAAADAEAAARLLLDFPAVAAAYPESTQEPPPRFPGAA